MTRVLSLLRYPLLALIISFFLWDNLRSSFELQVVNPAPTENANNNILLDGMENNEHYHFYDNNDKISLLPKQENKPYLIIHIGPPKTASTTLQEELFANPRMLASDRYLYTGAFNKDGQYHGDIQSVKDLFSMDCHRKLERVRIHHEQEVEEEEQPQLGKHHNIANRTSLADKLRQVNCWKDSLKALEAYRIQNTNLIHSDETRSIMRWKKWYNMSYPAPFDLISLRQVLQDDWNVIIVVTYRRYWEWIMSSKQHIERYTRKKPRHRQWPSFEQQQQQQEEEDDDDGSGGGGFDFQAPLPTILTVEPGNSSYYPFYYTDTILNAIRSFLPVKILNLHDEHSVRSSFLCSVLDNAPHACRDSLQQDANQIETRANMKKHESVFYNILATAAVRKGLVNPTAYKRRRVVIDTMRFHQQQDVLGKSSSPEEDWPMICPTEMELESLLQLSLDKEKAILPDFYASQQAEHRDSFWKAVQKNTFCWIDTDKVLEENVWRRFFSQYS